VTRRSGSGRVFLTLAALGVVFGDIGTSPLYALRECFGGSGGVAATEANVVGVVSLICWSLVFVVAVKYVFVVMRADMDGEGGILALVALVHRTHRRFHPWLTAVGLFGAALLYGDGMITPAVSVLSAVEGLNVATRAFEPFVVPGTIAVLVILFAVQHRGTSGIGGVFGPIMTVWFAAIAVTGAMGIRSHPAILSALNPVHALAFPVAHGWGVLVPLGAAFLALTGAEALYADLGQFGRAPIRIAWFSLVFPALILNYLGQGAVLLADPGAQSNPFYALAPGRALYPMVTLATVATVVASQSIITGAFSMTKEAIALGYAPHLEVRHTSSADPGQIYVPAVNWILMIATVGLVLSFRSATRLAGAYGVAVVTTMMATDVLMYAVARERWRWSVRRAALGIGLFVAIDLAFAAANAIKIARGGWLPLLVAGALYAGTSSWHARQARARAQRRS